MKILLMTCITIFLTAFMSVDAIASGSCTGVWTYGYITKSGSGGRGTSGEMNVNESAGTQPSLQACANALVAQVQFQCNSFCSGPEGCAINPSMRAQFLTQDAGTQTQIVPMTCHS